MVEKITNSLKINQFPLMFYTVVDIFTNVIILRTHSGILYWGSFISNKTKINIKFAVIIEIMI